jgi:hypothetical protein
MSNVSENVKSILAASTAEGFQSLAKDVGGHVRSDRTKWAKYRATFAKLSADFPRLDNGAIDRESEVCEAAREVFIAHAILSLTEGSEYDRPLHSGADDMFYTPSEDRPANFTLTGRNAVSMDKGSLAKLPNLVDNPFSIRRYVEATRKTVDNTATKAWGRFFEAEFVESKGGRGANATTEDWCAGLQKPMIAKLNADRKAGIKRITNEQAKKELAKFCKALLG